MHFLKKYLPLSPYCSLHHCSFFCFFDLYKKALKYPKPYEIVVKSDKKLLNFEKKKKKMANLLGIVKQQQQAPIDEEKLLRGLAMV